MSRTRGVAAGPSPMTNRRTTRRLVAILLPGVVALLTACGAYGRGTLEATPMEPPASNATSRVSPQPSTGRASTAATAIPDGHRALPAAFPVPAGAVAEPPSDDPTIVAQWTLDEAGSGPYDYYVEALPAAGYPIVGRYPADQAALLRFEVAPGTIWQLLLEHAGGGTRITVQTDRP